ncbi:MAG: hypothetical protein ACI9UR_000063 [Bacteroidia bacterium]|jgi:hypothetical protein
MNKTALVIALFVGAVTVTGCEVCTTCTESTTSTVAEFCGKANEVKDGEETLENTVGQDWSCVRD